MISFVYLSECFPGKDTLSQSVSRALEAVGQKSQNPAECRMELNSLPSPDELEKYPHQCAWTSTPNSGDYLWQNNPIE
ncbi:MAG: hypothetical protein CME31_27300 [Gimesia sp.]|uniref:Uncharacterized protein n=1 Tax=Gimesia maris TaxID=122 RepID=A0A3D3R1S7_9PLAN|nr:hypothetical protein [Gimesia sp.]HCO22168.1 hypothetical protein [Gimesia maris]